MNDKKSLLKFIIQALAATILLLTFGWTCYQMGKASAQIDCNDEKIEMLDRLSQ